MARSTGASCRERNAKPSLMTTAAEIRIEHGGAERVFDTADE